jgi:TRAP transporter TAXI family solute receptor
MTLTRNRIMFGTLALATGGLIAWAGSLGYDRVRDRVIVIAAGDARSEGYILAQAIRTVVERRHPYLRVQVTETAGTSESLALLDKGKAQYAVAQADVIAGAHARGEARLFEELFQIVVREDSQIRAIDDLRGKTIALARRGEQFQSFLYLARRRGMGESDFKFVGDDNDSAGALFARGQADAFFAVRPLHTAALTRITQNIPVRFLPIDTSSALRLEVPAYRAGVILKGSYSGTPAIPDSDVQTVALDRLLLAHEDVPDYIAFTIAEVLTENRQEIAQAIPDADDSVRPLTVSIRPPDINTGLAAALHPGAQAYYRNGKLSVSAGEIVMGAALTGTLGWLWLLAFRRVRMQRQKQYSDAFNMKMMKLVEEAHSDSHRSIEEIRNDSLRLLGQVVADLDAEKISQQAFQSSRAIWQIAYDLMREGASIPGAPAGPARTEEPTHAPPAALLPEFTVEDEEDDAEDSKQRPWSMWRDG